MYKVCISFACFIQDWALHVLRLDLHSLMESILGWRDDPLYLIMREKILRKTRQVPWGAGGPIVNVTGDNRSLLQPSWQAYVMHRSIKFVKWPYFSKT